LALFEWQPLVMPVVEFSKVDFYYGDTHVVKCLDLDFEGGNIITIMGPSGCGKSTVLRLIAGLEKPARGTIKFEGLPLMSPSSQLRYARF
jgi:ABC-type Fe3+/spermidine/putrescine transport system ATPase subunit